MLLGRHGRDARAVANWFVARAYQDGRSLTIMQLTKLVYVAHGWHLALYGKPLIKNRIEAWKYGPVIPAVYNVFRQQGIDITGGAVDSDGNAFREEFTAQELDLLEQVWQIYGSASAFDLSEMTHQPDSPWATASRENGFYASIDNDVIERHYRTKSPKVMAGV